jgi:glycerol-3-phosphate dehydrogenase
MVKPIEADVVIVGGGVGGAALARELSRYKVETILVEKESDFSSGETKGSHGMIYAGPSMVFSIILKSIVSPGEPLYQPDSLKLKLVEEGFDIWNKGWLSELDIRHTTPTTLVVARDDDDMKILTQMKELGQSMGERYADMKEADRETIFAMEPNISRRIIGGLCYEGTSLAAFPPEVTIALAENAKQNGVRIMLEAEVTGVSHNGGVQVVHTTKGGIKTNFIVNVAGRYADIVADMGGARDWNLLFHRSQMLVLDRRLEGLIKTSLHAPPRPGILTSLVTRPDGNPYVFCGVYIPTNNREDLATRRLEFSSSIASAQTLIPGISEKDIITSFTGERVFNTRDPEENIIEPSSTNPRFINVAIRLPGMAASAAIAKYVVNMLADQGLELVTKSDFNPYRKSIPRFRDLGDDEKAALIARDPRYGHVICRCEMVTEGEIVEAIKRGARTVQGIQFRTRAGMGRCQRGFCGPRLVSILARELGIPVTEVTQKGPGSNILLYNRKELLQKVMA